MTENNERGNSHLPENAPERFSTIPIHADGSKAPAIAKWKPFQARIATKAEQDHWPKDTGRAVVCGKISGGLEVLDFETLEAYECWLRGVDQTIVETLPVISTPGGGRHVYLRSESPLRSVKLARAADGKLLSETRGEGAYALLPESPPSCHPSGKIYERLSGPALERTPVISTDERDALFDVARAQNEYVGPSKIIAPGSNGASGLSPSGTRPGDIFNENASWDEVLEPHGWSVVRRHADGKVEWRRRGKETGSSATTGFCKNETSGDLLYVFSTNAQPFEAESCYSKFAAYALLNCGGDFTEAACVLSGRDSREGVGIAVDSDAPATPEWQGKLEPEAFHGLAGDIVRTIEPHTEADPAALLVQFLVAFGSVIGRKPRYRVEATDHHMNLFVTLVGATSKGRKGTSFDHIRGLVEEVDPTWKNRVKPGALSSGEGLIWIVRDPIYKKERNKKTKKFEDALVDEGIEDKRALVVESEFASCLRVTGREGNNLSPIIRNAWDRGDLETFTKNSPARATGAHISIIGHITCEELRRHMDRTEAANGFGNRFLWVFVRRSKCLPEGGRIQDVDFTAITDRLKDAYRTAIAVDYLERDEEARAVWAAVYRELSEGAPGMFGAVTGRAEAQVLRLSCIYALLDSSDVVRKEHIRAALAVWQYCEDSARFIFGESTGDPVADDILRALRPAPQGLSRTEIHSVLGRHAKGAVLGRALSYLVSLKLARSERREPEGRGRPAEVWFATTQKKTPTNS